MAEIGSNIGIGNIKGIPEVGSAGSGDEVSKTGAGFGDMLAGALQDVNALEMAANDEARKVATGQSVDLTDAVVASEKAKLAMDFTVEVRNKIVDAYKDLWRMPV